MATQAPPTRRILQNGWIVNDVREAAQRWVRQTGIGPFFLIDNAEMENQLYRGQPTDVKASFALAQAGDLQIELICQHNDSPSAYRETIPRGQEGFHHMMLYCENYDSDLDFYLERGAGIVFSAIAGGARFCYLDTLSTHGYMTELIEENPSHTEMFRMISEAARDWNGEMPLRTVS